MSAQKTDPYVEQAFATALAAGGPESATAPVTVPILVRLDDPVRWTPPPGFELDALLGHIVSGSGTVDAVRTLQDDPNVLGIEASRPAGVFECVNSVPFVRATRVHGATPPEKGDKALVGIIDSGIDLLHEAFLDRPGGTSRVVEIWDQRDPTGPTPRALYPGLAANFGSVHTATDIGSYLASGVVPARLGRDPQQHGTHVASIAAGRKVGTFGGGVAPEAIIVVVIAKLDTGPTDPLSIGYSRSHVSALAYIKEAAKSRKLPVVVNISLGMNAGAHDGNSLLESAFDEFSGGGRSPGLVVVKSAGNERGTAGHARLTLGPNSADTLRWAAKPVFRSQDVIELWFAASDEMSFVLRDPAGNVSAACDWASPSVTGTFAGGNLYSLSYVRYHLDNGDSRLLIVIKPGSATGIAPGTWGLDVTSNRVTSPGVIHAWIERIDARPIEFSNHLDEDYTLSIPGTARSVITVAAVGSAFPLRNTTTSSYGLTRDDRPKPDLAAPGTDIEAAQAGTSNAVVAMTGTSMAAPHVSGAVALLLSRKAKAVPADVPNAAQVRAALCQQSQLYNGHHTRNTGFGLLDVEALLAAFP